MPSLHTLYSTRAFAARASAALWHARTTALTLGASLLVAFSSAAQPVSIGGLSLDNGSTAYGNGTLCMVGPEGDLKCWGNNYHKKLGLNESDVETEFPSGCDPDFGPCDPVEVENYTRPKQVDGLTSGVTSVSQGPYHACAIRAGAVLCWGNDRARQTGAASSQDGYVRQPAAIPELNSGVTALALGADHSCALQAGAVKCWGLRLALGTGAQQDTRVPVQVPGLESGVTSISAGGDATCAIQNGAVKCWGFNLPMQVKAGLESGVTMVSFSGRVGCAIQNGGAKCWGNNALGQLGTGTTGGSNQTPQAVSGLSSGVSMISAANFHACAIHNSTVKCWGSNAFGQLGNGSTTDSAVPVVVAAPNAARRDGPSPAAYGAGAQMPFTQVFTGAMNTCALEGSQPYCWGNNTNGELANGGTGGSFTTPVQVSDVSVLPVELTAFTGTASGRTARLSWTTASETNNAGFVVEQQHGETWTDASGLIAGQGTTTERTDYAFDVTGLTAGRHTFRLRQSDTDGTVNYSAPVTVEIGTDGEVVVTVLANGSRAPRVRIEGAGVVRAEAYDVLGRRVSVLFDGAVAGTVEAVLPVGVSSGSYVVRVVSSGRATSHAVVVR